MNHFKFTYLITSLLVCLAISAASSTIVLASAQTAALAFTPQEAVVALDSTSEIGVEIRNVDGLYAFDLSIHYDPAAVEVVDADPAAPGIQVLQGAFLEGGLVVKNEVDSERGTIDYIMTQLNPSQPKSGTGNLLVLRLRGKQEGKSSLSVEKIQLSSRAGLEIPVTAASGDVSITKDALTGPTSTPLPVSTPLVQWTPDPASADAAQAPASTLVPTQVLPGAADTATAQPAELAAQATPETGLTATASPSVPGDSTVASVPSPVPFQPQASSQAGSSSWIFVGLGAIVLTALFAIWLRSRKL